MTQTVSIIDYGVGNLLNVVRAFQHCGAEVNIAEHAGEIKKAGLLVLPGVGAFSDGMNELQRRELVDSIHSHVKSGKPLLGICLGMQMLLETSEEFGRQTGLGVIKGSVIMIPNTGANGEHHKIPHIGWNQISMNKTEDPLNDIFCISDEYFYFVHSFFVQPEESGITLFSTNYSSFEFCSAVLHKNIFATQFHPEKSGRVGKIMIHNFLNVCKK